MSNGLFKEEIKTLTARLHALPHSLEGAALALALEHIQTTAEKEQNNQTGRPVVIALFGGTGVGKSSLFNALAGKELSSVSAERAHTKHPVVAYPMIAKPYLGTFLTADYQRHEVNSLDIILIDTPDIDSVEQVHQTRAFEIAAQADILVFVVTPRKYAYESSWQVLRKWAKRKRWFFVLNQCDLSADAATVKKDFMALLETAGFHPTDDVVFQTSLAAGADTLELNHLKQVLHSPFQVEQLALLRQEALLSRLLHVMKDDRFAAFATLEQQCQQQQEHICERLNEKLGGIKSEALPDKHAFESVLNQHVWMHLATQRTGIFFLFVWMHSLLHFSAVFALFRRTSWRRSGAKKGWKMPLNASQRHVIQSEKNRVRRWLEDHHMSDEKDIGEQESDDECIISSSQLEQLAHTAAKKAAHPLWLVLAHLLPLVVSVFSLTMMLKEYVRYARFDSQTISSLLFMLVLTALPGCWWLRVRVKNQIDIVYKKRLNAVVYQSFCDELLSRVKSAQLTVQQVVNYASRVTRDIEMMRNAIRKNMRYDVFGDAND